MNVALACVAAYVPRRIVVAAMLAAMAAAWIMYGEGCDMPDIGVPDLGK